jgi:hypothetical protein
MTSGQTFPVAPVAFADPQCAASGFSDAVFDTTLMISVPLRLHVACVEIRPGPATSRHAFSLLKLRARKSEEGQSRR